MVNQNIEKFSKIRTYLKKVIEEDLSVYLTDIWDPNIKYIIIEEVVKLENILTEQFPDFPTSYFPQCKFNLSDDSIEVELQTYLATESNLIFLGTNDYFSVPFDYYIRRPWDPSFNYEIVARYGNEENNVQYGPMERVKQEYNSAEITPLSTAYRLAVEDGYIF